MSGCSDSKRDGHVQLLCTSVSTTPNEQFEQSGDTSALIPLTLCFGQQAAHNIVSSAAAWEELMLSLHFFTI